jgi:hypothetical protein
MGDGKAYAVQGVECDWGMGKDYPEIALYLLDKVSLTHVRETRTWTGQTLLHWGAQKGYERVVEVGLERGIDPQARCFMEEHEIMTAKGTCGLEGTCEY